MRFKLYEYNLPIEELVNVYVIFIRSVEYSVVVWHSSISEEEGTNIKRIQKTDLKIILKEDYLDYDSALEVSGLKTLRDRRTRTDLS